MPLLKAGGFFWVTGDPDDCIRDSGEHSSLPVHKLSQDVACPCKCAVVGRDTAQGSWGTAQCWKHLCPPPASPWLICCSSVHEWEPRALYNVLVVWADKMCTPTGHGKHGAKTKKHSKHRDVAAKWHWTNTTSELGLHCSKKPFQPMARVERSEQFPLWNMCKEAKYFKSTSVRFLSLNTHPTCKKNPFPKPCNVIPR